MTNQGLTQKWQHHTSTQLKNAQATKYLGVKTVRALVDDDVSPGAIVEKGLGDVVQRGEEPGRVHQVDLVKSNRDAALEKAYCGHY